MAIRLKNHTKGLELWRGLSRYDSDLLLGLMPCAYFLRYRLYGFLSVAGIILCLLLDFQSALIGISATTKVVRVPMCCADKGPRTDCGGSAIGGGEHNCDAITKSKWWIVL